MVNDSITIPVLAFRFTQHNPASTRAISSLGYHSQRPVMMGIPHHSTIYNKTAHNGCNPRFRLPNTPFPPPPTIVAQ